MADHNNLPKAIDHYLAGTASEEEKVLVNNWYQSFDDGVAEVPDYPENYRDITDRRLQQRINASTGTTFTKTPAPVKKIHHFRYAAACLAILLVAGALFVYNGYKGEKNNITNALADLKPGGNKAMLTLADGRNFILGRDSTGIISTIDNVKINNSKAGQIEYQLTSVSSERRLGDHTLTTPRGGQFQLTLADGTRIWLNAGSSLRYPMIFTGNERRVHLTGEAYFEVAKNKLKPFKVEYSGQTVEVLGTHFNITAYPDENQGKTSLLEGSVKISNGTDLINLKPGQQSALSETSGKFVVQNIPDLDAVIAWKNGTFNFDSADIKTIMAEFSRWYDVDVIYKGPTPNYHLSGTYKRDLNGADLLQVFKLTGLNYIREGRKIIISK